MFPVELLSLIVVNTTAATAAALHQTTASPFNQVFQSRRVAPDKLIQ